MCVPGSPEGPVHLIASRDWQAYLTDGMERESSHGNDVPSRAGRPASGVLPFSEELGARGARGQRQVGADPRLCAGSENGLGVGRRVDQQQTQGTAEVLLRSGPRSSIPSVGEFILELEKRAALVAPRLAAGSGGARKQKQVSGQSSGECHGCLTAGFFQDAAQPSGSFARRRRCDRSLVVGSSRPPSRRFSTRRIYRDLVAAERGSSP